MGEERSKSWLETLGEVLSSEPQDREQLIEVLYLAKEKELLDAETLEMIESTLSLSEMRVREIMIPRSQMAFVRVDNELGSFLQTITETGYSRFPLFNEEEGKVLGLIFAKDLLPHFMEKNDLIFEPKNMARGAIFVPESKRLDALLREFKLTRNHMAMVVDEYGNVSGLVTIEDVLEQIVGDIEDEYDTDDGDDNIRKYKENTYIVKAITPTEDFNEYLSCSLPIGSDFDTIGGLLLQQFGHLPKRGETLTISEFHFTILHADHRRIRLIEVTHNK